MENEACAAAFLSFRALPLKVLLRRQTQAYKEIEAIIPTSGFVPPASASMGEPSVYSLASRSTKSTQ